MLHNGLELGAVLQDNFNYSLEHCAKLMMCEVREAASTSLAELQPDVAKGAKRISPHRLCIRNCIAYIFQLMVCSVFVIY